MSACVKLQSNSTYFAISENQRNDFVRDLLKMAKYDVIDQTRRGISSTEKCAGEVDILIEEDGSPVTIIEALNLDSLNTHYLDRHIDKIYRYDTVGNMFNIILSYVSVSNFSKFCEKYFKHIKEHQYLYPLLSADDSFRVENFPYSDIRVMKTVHIKFSNEENGICINFSDNGRGLDPLIEDPYSIFDLGMTTTKVQGGNGIGLNHVKLLVEDMNGHVEINQQCQVGFELIVRIKR